MIEFQAKKCNDVARAITFAAIQYNPKRASPDERRNNALALRGKVTALQKALAAEAAKLSSMHPGFLTFRESLAQQVPDFVLTDWISVNLRKIEAVQTALLELQPVCNASIWPKARWQDAAWDLMGIFVQAMRSDYPNRCFGHSPGGPVVRFVQALLPIVVKDGNKRSEANIGGGLKRIFQDGTNASGRSVPG
jgi:hypothetical protein